MGGDIVRIKKNSYTNCKSNLFVEYKEIVNHLFFTCLIARVIWLVLWLVWIFKKGGGVEYREGE